MVIGHNILIQTRNVTSSELIITDIRFNSLVKTLIWDNVITKNDQIQFVGNPFFVVIPIFDCGTKINFVSFHIKQV